MSLQQELSAFLSDLTKAYSRDGQFNSLTSPLGTRQIQDQAAGLLKALSSAKPAHYLVIVEGDVEPRLANGRRSRAAVLRDARAHRSADPNFADGLYHLKIDALGAPQISCFCGGELEQ